jgi:hypothetical protein
MDVNFTVIPDYLRNGEFEFIANGATLIQNASNELFNTTGQVIPVGHYRLDNPKLIRENIATHNAYCLLVVDVHQQ